MTDTRRRLLLRTGAAVVIAAGAAGLVAWPSSDRSTAATYGVVPSPPLPVAPPVTVPGDPFDAAVDIADHDGSVVVTVDDGLVRFTESDQSLVVGSGSPGRLRVVSADGDRAALFERGDGDQSVITVVERHPGAGIEPVRGYRFSGLIEPEAFSTDGTLLYVIDHETDRREGGYRVRPLDLATGELGATLGPNKAELVEVMNGRGRRQVWSPDATRLYTLYIRQTHHHHDQDDHGDGGGLAEPHVHGQPGIDAFVHVLDLDEEWAFCLDLPPAFGAGDLATTALAVSPDGGELAVVDANAGQVAFASTDDLAVVGIEAMPEIETDPDLHIGLTDDHLALASGTRLWWFERVTLAPVGAEPVVLPTPTDALTSGPATVWSWSVGAAGGPREVGPPN